MLGNDYHASHENLFMTRTSYILSKASPIKVRIIKAFKICVKAGLGSILDTVSKGTTFVNGIRTQWCKFMSKNLKFPLKSRADGEEKLARQHNIKIASFHARSDSEIYTTEYLRTRTAFRVSVS